MDNEEFMDFVDSLKDQGLSEEDILDVLYEAFMKGDLDREDLESAANSLGYKVKEDFMNEDIPDPKDFDGDNDDGDNDDGDNDDGDNDEPVTEDQIEAAKEAKPGESEEDFKERVADGEKADDSEREEAMKLFD